MGCKRNNRNYWKIATILLIPTLFTLIILAAEPVPKEKEMVDFPEFSVEKGYFESMKEVMKDEDSFKICNIPINKCVYLQKIK